MSDTLLDFQFELCLREVRGIKYPLILLPNLTQIISLTFLSKKFMGCYKSSVQSPNLTLFTIHQRAKGSVVNMGP